MQRSVLLYKMSSALLLNLLRPNLNFTACVEVDLSTRELHSRRHLKEKVCDHTNDVVYRPHLSKNSQFKFPTDTMLYHAQIAKNSFKNWKPFLRYYQYKDWISTKWKISSQWIAHGVHITGNDWEILIKKVCTSHSYPVLFVSIQ